MLMDPRNDQWLATERGGYIFSRQEKLIMELLSPMSGESVLEVGCGTGNYLHLFLKKNCNLTGIDSSDTILTEARSTLGHRCDLIKGDYTNLPFSDNAFDIACLINASQMMTDLPKIIAEIVRVSRNRIFIGFFNKHSLVGSELFVRKLFGFRITSEMRFFTMHEMRSLIREIMKIHTMTWGSVIYLPGPVYTFFSEFEELFPLINNPLGAFMGIVFPVSYTYRTVQNPVENSFAIKTKTRSAAPEAVRGMLQEGDR